MGAAIPAWIAEECYRVMSQEWAGAEEKSRGGPASAAKEWGPSHRKNSRAFQPRKERAPSKAVGRARWALTRKLVDGQGDADARLVAKGYQGPDSRDGLVETCGCASLQSFHLQFISLGAL